jgi:hypothetical protein
MYRYTLLRSRLITLTSFVTEYEADVISASGVWLDSVQVSCGNAIRSFFDMVCFVTYHDADADAKNRL